MMERIFRGIMLFAGGLVLAVMMAAPASTLEEAASFEVIRGRLAADPSCPNDGRPYWRRFAQENPLDGYRFRFSRFGCEIGGRGVLLVAPGRSESSVEYYETAMDFIALGFQPVYVIDHRGQGFSPRLLDDPSKGHVERFSDYVSDFGVFVEAVRRDLRNLQGGETADLFFLSSSMGGAIGLGYFQSVGDRNPFVAAALAGPMVRVNYLDFVDRTHSRLNLAIYSETGARLQALWRCRVVSIWHPERCNDYAAPDEFGAYRKGSRSFQPETEKKMTHSRERFERKTFPWDEYDWSDIAANEYGEDERWSGPQLGGATNAWVLATNRFNKEMRREGSLRKAQTMPLMLLAGTRDLRAYRPYPERADRAPDLSYPKNLCDDLNDISARQGHYICEFVALDGAFHELFKESDQYRNKAIATVNWFFLRKADRNRQ